MYNYDIYQILDDIMSARKKKIILDTDAFNEIDDQYAIAYAMLSKDRAELLGLTAAPFHNARSTGPEDGMLKSYDEIIKIANLVDENHNIPILKGSRRFLVDRNTPEDSEAADFIIEQAKKSDERIYVLAIGAITNVASALLKCPEIREKIVIVWLATCAQYTYQVGEFNMKQDVPAAQVVFDSQAPLVILPAVGSTDMLAISMPELDAYMKGKNKLCDYLYSITKNYIRPDLCAQKPILDIAAVAAIVASGTLVLTVGPTPIITDEMYPHFDPERHPMISSSRISRMFIFADMFKKLWTVK